MLRLFVICLIFSIPAKAQNVRLFIRGETTWIYHHVLLDGQSQVLLPATMSGSGARKGFILINPKENDTVYVDISGGTASAERGIPVLAGSKFQLLGEFGPYNAVSIIGNKGESIQLFTGQ